MTVMAEPRATSPYSRHPGAVLGGRRGVPAVVSVRATEVQDLHDELAAGRDEARTSWGEVRRHARIVHYATVAERPDIALHSAGQIVSLADRRLRQLGGGRRGMTLLDRIAARTCREPGCKRAPAYEGQAYCADHRLPWRPGWLAGLRAKDMTGGTA